MTIDLELQIATNIKTLPHPSQFKKWVKVVFSNHFYKVKHLKDLELTIRIVDEVEIKQLNHKYRNKNKVTNVLSFEGTIATAFDYYVLGDIIICAAVIEREAQQQRKELLSHWAHMVIHGILHLLNYDHEDPAEAAEMEQAEIVLMKKLGFSSPY